MVPWFGLQCMILVFPDPAHMLFVYASGVYLLDFFLLRYSVLFIVESLSLLYLGDDALIS